MSESKQNGSKMVSFVENMVCLSPPAFGLSLALITVFVITIITMTALVLIRKDGDDVDVQSEIIG